MKAKVDPDICIGCTLCVQTCPEVFKMDGDKAVVYTTEVSPNAQNTCRQAAEECPVTAIIVQ